MESTLIENEVHVNAPHENAVRKLRLVALRTRGYKRVGVDSEGRIVVEVDSDRYENHDLYRRAWGPEWPIVRSDKWRAKTAVEDQFAFSGVSGL